MSKKNRSANTLSDIAEVVTATPVAEEEVATPVAAEVVVPAEPQNGSAPSTDCPACIAEHTCGKRKGNKVPSIRRGLIFGQSMVSAIRWMGANGFTPLQVQNVLEAQDVQPRPAIATMKTQIYWGKKGLEKLAEFDADTSAYLLTFKN